MLIDMKNNTLWQSFSCSWSVDKHFIPRGHHLGKPAPPLLCRAALSEGCIEALCTSVRGVDLVVANDCSGKSVWKINPFFLFQLRIC